MHELIVNVSTKIILKPCLDYKYRELDFTTTELNY